MLDASLSTSSGSRDLQGQDDYPMNALNVLLLLYDDAPAVQTEPRGEPARERPSERS